MQIKEIHHSTKANTIHNIAERPSNHEGNRQTLTGVAVAKQPHRKDHDNHCGQQAKADSSVRKEEKYTAIYKACSAVNDLTLTALDAAVKKRSRDATVKSLEKRKLDLAGTFLEKMKDPALYLAEQVFVKHEQSYDDAVEFVAQMSTNCLYGKDG